MIRSTIIALLAVSTLAESRAAQVIVVNQTANDLGFSSVSGLVYASSPDSSSINPDSLVPINPDSGAVSTPIAIGFDPGRIGVSSDGTNIYTVVDGLRGVQRFNVPSQSMDQFFSISGGPQITDLYAVPGNANEVFFHEAEPGFSPPAITTVVYNNGVALPDHIGNGLGVGGPDIITVDPTNGASTTVTRIRSAASTPCR